MSDTKNNVDLNKNDEVYLVHSFFLEPKNQNNILANCNYYGFATCREHFYWWNYLFC